MDFQVIEKIKAFVKENKLLTAAFLLTLIFFLVQHAFALGWDFSAYVINARFFFGHGDYAEVLRAPMTSLLLVGEVFLGKIGEYFYITIAVILFFLANIKLSSVLYDKYFKKFELKKKTITLLFFLLSVTPFTLHYGLLEGTELLSLAFFEFFLAYLILGKVSGHFLGFAVLTRYNFMAYIPLLFVNRDWKKILKNLGLFAIVMAPWLIYNYIRWGNFFTSIVDAYNQNIIARQGIIKAFDFSHLAYSLNFLIPLIILGMGIFIFRWIKRKESKESIKIALLFFLIFVVVIWDYNGIPLKLPRYLFNITLPAAFFSTIGFSVILKKIKSPKNKKRILLGFIAFWAILLIITGYMFYNARGYDQMYKQAANEITALGLESCYVASPLWVPVNYYTGDVYSLWKTPQQVIADNGIVLIFPNEISPSDTFTLDSITNLPVLAKSNAYIFLAKEGISNKTCEKRFPYSEPGVIGPCSVIAGQFEKIDLENFVDKVCLLFNKK